MTLSIPTNFALASFRSEGMHGTSNFPTLSDFTNMGLPDGSTLWFARRDHPSGQTYYLVKILRSGEQQTAILDTGRMNPSERMAFLLYQCQMDRIQFRAERRAANEQLRAADEQLRVLQERARAEMRVLDEESQAREQQRRAERAASEQRMQAGREAHEEQMRASEERRRALDEQRRVERQGHAGQMRVLEEQRQAEINAFNEQMNAFRRQNEEALNGSSSVSNISPSNQFSSPDQLQSVQFHSSVVGNNVASNEGNPEENPSTSFFEKIEANISFFLLKSFRT